MSEATLELVQAKQAELATLIEQLQRTATLQQTVLALPEAHITLQPGEHYAGAVLNEDGLIKHHLVLMAPRASDLTWQAATDWAARVGGELPTRQEQALLFANCKPHLEERWHWSAETNGASYAWHCYFVSGCQRFGSRSFEGSAVAVRRLNA